MSKKNKNVIGFMKNEIGDKIITKFATAATKIKIC